jgi:hypothetical protein
MHLPATAQEPTYSLALVAFQQTRKAVAVRSSWKISALRPESTVEMWETVLRAGFQAAGSTVGNFRTTQVTLLIGLLICTALG